ncbi:hypothetical protein CEV34_1846 [Brucella pseudogrignonensis]|uniref:Uncharacterized protein n=1 Tax=Brucella pseudogrignonensis TaxID=419475 RepID=A0A256GK22_9HYPH|nr:hypothetical protein CEV34_1846 [Brucella pseudogrignonensis]
MAIPAFGSSERFQLILNRWNRSIFLFLRIILTQNRFALLLEML